MYQNLPLILVILLAMGFLCWMAYRYGQKEAESREPDQAGSIKPEPPNDMDVESLEFESEHENNMAWLPDAIIILDGQMQLNWANRTAETWFGFKLENHFQMKFSSILNSSELISYLERKDFADPYECEAPGASEIKIRIRIVPYRQGGYLLQARDVTQVKVLEKVRRDFVANASHELRTPISILYGYLEMMLQEGDKGISKEWKQAISQMHGQTARVKQIIEDMMILSRLEDPVTIEEHQPVDMQPVLLSAGENAVVLSGKRNHKIRTDIDEGSLLHCNQKEIESLVANLVTNAVRYTPDNGSITIRWTTDLSGGMLAVVDTGIGIDPADIPRITERFYRTDPARSRETGGTGLGLAIVNHIVNRHQANLLVQSEPGKGSTFSIAFPPTRIVKPHGQRELLLN